MFYPPSVPTPAVVDAMWEAEHRIACDVPVAVGMCVHRGHFYELGGGLYGHDAHIVETAAEYDAGPEEVLVTQSVLDACPREYEFKLREDLRDGPPLYSLIRAAGMRHLDRQTQTYPHPFPQPFFERLHTFRRQADVEPVRRELYDAYRKQSVIVFLARAHDSNAGWDGAGLLDDLVANVLLDALIIGLDGIQGHIAALGGGLAILAFDTAAQAYEAARALQQRFKMNSVRVKIGISSGPVLLFSNPNGPSGIAGNPVNIASKISEDTGVVGRINLSADVAAQLPGVGGDPFEAFLGGVVLRGITTRD
jgi:class 3 adenylate cyclase